jgi:hypothetical protein
VFSKPQRGEILAGRLACRITLATVPRQEPAGQYEFRGIVMKVIVPLIVTFALIGSARAASPLANDFWLLGNFTQNVPCKGDGSDPTELKVKITTDEIDSKVGVCKFLDAKVESKRISTHVECQFPAGPLMGDITFTLKGNDTIDFVDQNNTYTATLYRCPK